MNKNKRIGYLQNWLLIFDFEKNSISREGGKMKKNFNRKTYRLHVLPSILINTL